MVVKAVVVVICIAAFIFVWSWCDLLSDIQLNQGAKTGGGIVRKAHNCAALPSDLATHSFS